jgi:phosphoglycerol transferase MdoB-like AlkP superfamily enzyme
MKRANSLLNAYLRISLTIAAVFILLRLYEYFAVGVKFNFLLNTPTTVLLCIYSDLITWLIYIVVFIIPFCLFYFINKKIAIVFLHSINILIIISLFGLIFVFGERSVPFDHELFVRKFSETTSTIFEVFYGRFWAISPIFLIVVIYFVLYKFILSKISIKPFLIYLIYITAILTFVFQSFIVPKEKQFKSINDYYYISNKLLYFNTDIFNWLLYSKRINTSLFSNKEILNEIDFYQQHNDFTFVDKNFPLLHIDDTKDVLGSFFRHSDTLPNIVVIIYEGLSRDISGYDAEAGSFTPFLDSLAEHSLHWQNCLSSADATFASAPSILGSLPFGYRGFTQLEKSIEHLSLVKILKDNGYSTFYFAGSEINFDNFACFMLDQGTEYLSMWYGPKYVKMGNGPEGLSAGYPDQAIFDRSFEILNDHPKTPYISTYLTLSTHSPFIFKERLQYDKLLEKILRERNISEPKRQKLFHYKPMLSSFLYSDNCLRNFFTEYKKRPEFKNTIFIITGDHHHGFYPCRNAIDDFNVPLIIYSPMLYKGVRFESVNTHINIAPSLLAFLKNSHKYINKPRYAHWLGNQLDTCRSFRCIHNIPFMSTNRDIECYVSGNYYFAYNTIYKILPGLNLQEIEDDSLLNLYQRKLDNFKFINIYVCENNLLYPKKSDASDEKLTEIFSFTNSKEQEIKGEITNFEKVSDYSPPPKYKKIKVQISFETKFDSSYFDDLPNLTTRIFNIGKDTLYKQVKYMDEYIVHPKLTMIWVNYLENDIYDLTTFPKIEGNSFQIQFVNKNKVFLKIRNLKVVFYGID